MTITYRGKPAVRLVAVDQGAPEQGTDRLPAFGMWRERQDIADVDAHVRELRGGRASCWLMRAQTLRLPLAAKGKVT